MYAKKCGEIKEEIIAATGHTEVIDKDIAATCTTDGIKTYICKNCGEKTDEIIIPAAGHKLVLAKNVAVTCTENGIKKYECKNCKDKIDTVIIPATGHKTVADIGIAATCTTPGKTAGSHCSVCSRVLVSQNTIPAKGHMYRDIKIQATTKQNGSITKKCSTCGIESDRKTIYYPKTISLSKNSYSYDGKAKKPTVIVRGSNGKIIAKSNYRIFYKNNTKAGIATISIQYQGDYKGNITKTFKIMPKGTKLKTLSAVSKGFTVKWIKQSSQTTGYEIQYSTDSRFKNSAAKVKTVEKNTVTSQTIKKLAAKKKYYVRIRTYKQVSVNGKKQKLYSAWSTVRTIKTL